MAESLFTSQTPGLLDVNEAAPTSVAIGLTFASAGNVTDARVYGPATIGVGTYAADLYQVTGSGGTGTLLGSVTFGALSPGVWTTATFSSAIAVTTGVAYKIVLRTSAGRYTATGGLFAGSSIVSGNITAWQDGTNPVGIGALANGTFVGDLTSYPTSTFGSNGYFIDVVFTAGAASASPTGLAVPITFGTPTVALNRTAAPTGLSVPITFGSAAAGITVQPNGLSLPISFGSPTVAPTVLSAERPGSWWGMVTTNALNREYALQQRRPPVACPNDGEPLEAVNGVLHCRYDGWTYGGFGTR